MKKLVFLLIFSPLVLWAQPRSVNQTYSATQQPQKELTEAQRIMQKAKTGKPYDVTRNFLAGNNLYSYIGQELYVIPPEVSTSFLGKIIGLGHGSYGGFLNENVTEYSSRDELDYWPYKGELGDRGTHAKYLAGRTFVVDKIRQVIAYPHEFIFYLRDKKTGERVKFLYNTQAVGFGEVQHFWGFPNFPFLTLSHFKYLQKKYIGNPLVVAAHPFEANYEGKHKLDAVDINTNDSITFPEADYYIFKVEDIVLDEKRHKLCYQLTDGKHSFLSPLDMSYNEPSYTNHAARKFLKSDWDKLVSQYGQSTMEAILCTEITETMDTTLVYLAYGTGVSYDTNGDYMYISFCDPDYTVIFDKDWHIKGQMYGKCTEVKKQIIITAAATMITFRTVNTAGRIIRAPAKIAKKFIDFFGI